MGGTIGALLTGIFATRLVNPVFKDAQGNNLAVGLVDGNWHQVVNQLRGIAIGWVIGGLGTLLILKVVDTVIGLRISPEHEALGLDTTQHGEEGYYWEASAS